MLGECAVWYRMLVVNFVIVYNERDLMEGTQGKMTEERMYRNVLEIFVEFMKRQRKKIERRNARKPKIQMINERIQRKPL